MGLFRDILNFKPDGGSTPSCLTAAIGCSMGRIRDNNEDNFYFNGRYLKNSENKGLEEIWTDEQTMPNERSGNWLLYGIFDGMGGGSYGELASALPLRQLMNSSTGRTASALMISQLPCATCFRT